MVNMCALHGNEKKAATTAIWSDRQNTECNKQLHVLWKKKTINGRIFTDYLSATPIRYEEQWAQKKKWVLVILSFEEGKKTHNMKMCANVCGLLLLLLLFFLSTNMKIESWSSDIPAITFSFFFFIFWSLIVCVFYVRVVLFYYWIVEIIRLTKLCTLIYERTETSTAAAAAATETMASASVSATPQ